MVTTHPSPAPPERPWHSPAPKSHYDVVIIGGGGHGLATAYYLASRHGIRDVAVLESGELAGGTAGPTAVLRSDDLFGENAALHDHALGLWEQLPAELEDDSLLSRRGVLDLAHSEQEVRDGRRRVFANWLSGAEGEWLTPGEIRAVCPILNTGTDVRYPVLGAAFRPGGGVVEHGGVARALARKAGELGVDLIRGCTATGLRTSGEKVTGVETSLGPISAGRVGLAGGGRTAALTEALGLRLPLRNHLLQTVVSELLEPVQPCVVLSRHVRCCSQGREGELVLGASTDEHDGSGQCGPAHLVERQMSAALELFPVFAKAHVLRTCGGAVDVTPDAAPIIAPAPHEGLFLNCGWGSGGSAATPAAGHLFAHTIATGRPHPINAAYGLERFTTGALTDEHEAAVVH